MRRAIHKLVSILLFIELLLSCGQAFAYEAEMGAVVIKDTFADPTWTSVSFAQAFSVPPVVVSIATNQGGDVASVRIRNVTTSGFEILQVEPNANDGPHVQMNTAYFAIEPGSHLLPNGNRIIAIAHSTNSTVGRFIPLNWDTVVFPAAFNSAPAVITQIQTMANESLTPPSSSSVPFLEVAVQNAGTTQMQVALERAETTTGTVSANETIGIVAVESGADFTFTDAFGTTVQLQTLRTPDNIQGWDDGCFANSYPTSFTSTPLSVASMNSRDGNNGGWMRRCSESAATIGLTVDEDIDNDSERNHTNEIAGVIAASVAFHANFGVDLQIAKNVTVTADPVNGASGPFAIPNADMQYVIGISNQGSASPDNGSLVITDQVPGEIRICVTVACQAGGPVVLDVSGSATPPGVSLGTVSYSNDGGGSFVYVPIPDADGYDAAVDAVRIELNGQMASIAPGGAPSFDLVLAARVN